MPRTIGRFQVRSELGRGGFGAIYLAHGSRWRMVRWSACDSAQRGVPTRRRFRRETQRTSCSARTRFRSQPLAQTMRHKQVRGRRMTGRKLGRLALIRLWSKPSKRSTVARNSCMRFSSSVACPDPNAIKRRRPGCCRDGRRSRGLMEKDQSVSRTLTGHGTSPKSTEM